jgi:hypothetical protein
MQQFQRVPSSRSTCRCRLDCSIEDRASLPLIPLPTSFVIVRKKVSATPRWKRVSAYMNGNASKLHGILRKYKIKFRSIDLELRQPLQSSFTRLPWRQKTDGAKSGPFMQAILSALLRGSGQPGLPVDPGSSSAGKAVDLVAQLRTAGPAGMSWCCSRPRAAGYIGLPFVRII